MVFYQHSMASSINTTDKTCSTKMFGWHSKVSYFGWSKSSWVGSQKSRSSRLCWCSHQIGCVRRDSPVGCAIKPVGLDKAVQLVVWLRLLSKLNSLWKRSQLYWLRHSSKFRSNSLPGFWWRWVALLRQFSLLHWSRQFWLVWLCKSAQPPLLPPSAQFDVLLVNVVKVVVLVIFLRWPCALGSLYCSM